MAALLSAITVALSGQTASDYVAGVCGVEPGAPRLEYLRAGALLDARSETMLFSRRGVSQWAPASLTKLVTLATALEAAETGGFDLDRPAPVVEAAWASNIAPGSSLMFLGPHQAVDGEDLLLGLMVSSGNDAAVEIAHRVGGGVGPFAALMNASVRERGFPFYFEEPAGLSPANRITAEGFARYTGGLIAEFGDRLLRYTSAVEYGYPLARHMQDGRRAPTVVQQNRNRLVLTYRGADGLKTGFIDESGYNIVATASRDGRRLIAVVLGVDAPSHAVGGQRRNGEAVRLLDWGFTRYREVDLSVPDLSDVSVWGGRERSVPVAARVGGPLSIPSQLVDGLRGEFRVRDETWAPVAAGERLGSVVYLSGTCVVREIDVIATREVARGGLFRRMLDRVRWWWRSIGLNRSRSSSTADSRSDTRERRTGS